jgi:hypothetical protein
VSVKLIQEEAVIYIQRRSSRNSLILSRFPVWDFAKNAKFTGPQGATVPRHTCTVATPMLHAQTRARAARIDWPRRRKSTRGLNLGCVPWKHGILDANKLITWVTRAKGHETEET